MMSISVPQPNDGFEWTQAPWGAVLRCRALAPFADHVFTAAPLALRDDEAEWDALAVFAGVPPSSLRLMTQVHGHDIAVADTAADSGRPTCDGIISRDRALALVVRVADCAPILIADTRTGAVAAVHAGWRSTMQSIGPAAVGRLALEFGSRPQDLVVAIGPSLGQCCGEMGDEVVAAFRTAGHAEEMISRWFLREPGRRSHFDLWQANRDQLEGVGVPPSAIHIAGLCTRTHPEIFHSYRARGPAAGRMAGVIRRR